MFFAWCRVVASIMNSVQIQSILQHTLGDTFCGVFAADTVPKKLKTLPAAMVVNTDPSDQPGTHWVALFFDVNNHADYFDSYGEKPAICTINDLLRFCESWNYNDKQIQANLSSVCGHYCVYFAIQRAAGKTFEELLKDFSREDLEENDTAVTEWVNETFDLNTQTYNVDFIVNQICRALL